MTLYIRLGRRNGEMALEFLLLLYKDQFSVAILGGSQLPVTLALRIQCPFLISVGTTHSWHTLRQTHLKSMIGRQWGQTSVGCISSFSNTITELFYVCYLSFLGSCDSRISTSCQPQNLFFKFTPESIYPYSCLQG